MPPDEPNIAVSACRRLLSLSRYAESPSSRETAQGEKIMTDIDRIKYLRFALLLVGLVCFQRAARRSTGRTDTRLDVGAHRRGPPVTSNAERPLRSDSAIVGCYLGRSGLHAKLRIAHNRWR